MICKDIKIGRYVEQYIRHIPQILVKLRANSPFALLHNPVHKTLGGHFFVFGTRTAVVCIGIDGNASSRGKYTRNLDILGIHQTDKVLHYLIHAVLVEIAVVAETEKIEFQAFGLHHLHVRDIGNAYFGKIRLPCNRTQAGEFRAIELHPIVIVLMPVYECLQD